MSEPQDADAVRRAWAAVGRRDIPAMLDALHPEVEAIPFGAAMEGRVYRGHEGVRGWLEDEIWTTYDTFETHPEEFQELAGQLLVFGRWIARGKESGVDLEIAATWVVDIRDGKVARWQTYTDRDEAIRDARARSQR